MPTSLIYVCFESHNTINPSKRNVSLFSKIVSCVVLQITQWVNLMFHMWCIVNVLLIWMMFAMHWMWMMTLSCILIDGEHETSISTNQPHIESIHGSTHYDAIHHTLPSNIISQLLHVWKHRQMSRIPMDAQKYVSLLEIHPELVNKDNHIRLSIQDKCWFSIII